MRRGYWVNDKGVPGYFGSEGDSKAIKLAAAGYAFVSADHERPGEVHTWDGEAWVESPTLVAEKARQEVIRSVEATDQHMPRIVDDLIAALVSKKLIALADLPSDARKKLKERADLRKSL